MIRPFYSIQELIEIGVPSLPKSHQGILKKADREGWISQSMNKLGGGREYSFDSLPLDAQEYILKTFVGNSQEVIDYKEQEIAGNNAIDINDLKPYQREVIDARAIILAEVEKLSAIYGVNNGIKKFIELISHNDVSEEIKNALIRANAKSAGKPVKVSRATIFNWRKAVKETGTVAGLAQKEIREADWPAWGDLLLKLWQVPQKPTLQGVWEQLIEALPKNIEAPSYWS